MDLIEFGQFLKKLRKKKGITLAQLANEAKVSHSYLSQIENGKKANYPSSEVLINLSKPLGIFYGELLKEAGYLNNMNIDDPNDELTEERYNRERYMDYEEIDEDEPYWTELSNLLTQEPDITYRGYFITSEERKLIIAYLDGLFAKKEGEQIELNLPEDRQDNPRDV